MEAGAQALKQERLAKKKLQALQKSRVGTWFEAILKFLGVDKLNKYQRALLAFVLYAAMWPNALPLRLLRDKFIRQLVVVRDTFISNVAANLVGLTSTGLIISMGSQRTGGMVVTVMVVTATKVALHQRRTHRPRAMSQQVDRFLRAILAQLRLRVDR